MKKIVRKDNSRRKKILGISLVLFLFMGIGYSVISSNLLFNGNIELSKYESPYLYDVLKFEALRGGLARKYTGEHHDSFTEEPSKDIYHWYASNNNDGVAVQDKNNVIFANHCWQMIRTTDTGGVKMIYNGEVEDGKCLNTRGNHVGYSSLTNQTLSSNYWYGTDYTYDSTNNVFSLSGTTEQATWNATTGPNLIGKYTCKSTSESDTCATLYLVESYVDSSKANVIPLNSNSNYSQFGTLQFNVNHHSPSDVGYMYNTVYPSNTKTMTTIESVLSSSSIAVNHWYADSVTWGNPTANKYNLDNPYQISSTTDYSELVGKYTFRNATETYTNTSVYYIVAVNNVTMYYIELGNSGNHTLSDFNYTYTYGDSFTDNGNGTYTINSPSTINRSDWYTSYSNIVANKYLCKNAVNNTCSDLLYTTASSNTSLTYIKMANNYKYAKSFTWDGSKYILDDSNAIRIWNFYNNADRILLNNAHYTCFNDTGECTTIDYVFFADVVTPQFVQLFSIKLSGGKEIDEALNEMLVNTNVNQINSTIKSGIDAWYKHFLLDYYDGYIEDTIFCNDRSIRSLNGWDPDGGDVSGYLEFKEYELTSDFNCTNNTDKFSISNSDAKLTYKVGQMSSPEMYSLGNSNSRKTGQYYWLSTSRYFFSSDAGERNVSNNGTVGANKIQNNYGVRPAISLKPGTEYIKGGDGSMANPYVVKPIRECTYNGDLTQGAEFVDGQYTYRYMQEFDGLNWQNINDDGWGVKLTDKNSTDPVNTKLCTTINGKPIVSMSHMFYDSKASSIDLSSFDTSNVTNMSYMFYYNITPSIDLKYLDTSNVVNMASMFCRSENTTYDLSRFDTSKVIFMGNMFAGTGVVNLDLSRFDTRKVFDMSNMFNASQATSIDVSSFNTKKVGDMGGMFSTCSNLTSLDLGSFDNTNNPDSKYMFCGINSNIISYGTNFITNDDMFLCESDPK